MKVEKNNSYLVKNNNIATPNFKGPLDGLVTQALTTIETNEMVNAALVDVFSMVIPRTYVDTKKRNKYAGAETFFREFTGTVIVCLSSGFIAKGISHLYHKLANPQTKVNPNSWVGNDSLKVLETSWNNSNNDTKKYVSNILSNLLGRDGRSLNRLNDDKLWEDAKWYDDKKWAKFNWKNENYTNIQDKLKNKDEIVNTLTQIIDDKNLDKKDAEQIQEIVSHRISNVLRTGNSVTVELSKDMYSGTSVKNLIRDIYDLGKNVFTNKDIVVKDALAKLRTMNKVKTFGALAIASTLGLADQYINRQITKKRTGSDNFVGDLDYDAVKNNQSSKKTEDKKNSPKLIALKLLASAGIIFLAKKVMKIVHTFDDFKKQLEFTGPITSGNAIRTVYTATLVGRFLAAKNQDELRESATRDYLGFINWLVLGGFVAKGVGHMFFGKDLESLFNINGDIKGVKNWLNNFGPKTHNEILAHGEKFAKANIFKANIIQSSGLIYSTVALGVLLPMLNIAITKFKHKHEKQNALANVA